MTNPLAEKLRRAFVYPAKLLRTLSLRGALAFIWAYRRRNPYLKVRVRSFPFPIWLRPRASDIRVAYEIFSTRELEMPWPLAEPPVAIIDGGANVGYATLALKHRWPEASVIAVEPDADNFAVLQKNTADLHSVSLVQRGIWGTRCSLCVKPDPCAAAWSLQFEPVPETTPGGTPSETVPNLIELFSGNHCDLLKLDIEGAELNVFSQADLSWIERVSVILIEIHSDAAERAVLNAAKCYNLLVAQAGEKVMLYRSAKSFQKEFACEAVLSPFSKTE